MFYENFYYMVFARHSAGFTWSSICIQVVVLHVMLYCITRFLYKSGKSDENDYLYVQNTEVH